MKRLLSILAALMILMTGIAAGEAAVGNENSDFEIEGTTLVKYKGKGGEVTVPDGITTLGAYAFEYTYVKKVNLPDSLKTIKDHCFMGCEELTDITIPAGVNKIDDAQVFGYCHSLPEIRVAEGNKRYSSADGILFTADKRTLLYYPEGKSGETYSIPEGTTQLGRTALGNNLHIKTLILPSTLGGRLEGTQFSHMPNLQNILVSPANNNYRSFDGILYDRTNMLIYYPEGRNAESLEKKDFPEGIKSIKAWAFQNVRRLKTVELPEGIPSVEWMCFSFADGPESITIPASVKSINGYAFSYCKNLKRVTILNPNVKFKREDCNILNGTPDAVLYGYEGSTTQAYAEKYGLKFESLGAVPGKEAKAAANTKEDKAPAAEQAAEKAATPEKDFEIDGTTLVKYKGRGGEVTVPEGVTKLGKWAFEDSNVTKVNLPESLKEIESYCFFSSKNLQEVTIPAGTNKISEAQVFAFCTGIEEFRVAEGNKRYTTVDGVLFTADKRMQLCYPDGKKDATYIIPEKTTKLGYTAFESNAQMTTLVIPSTLANSLEGTLFSNLSVLQNIFVSPANNNYRSFDGVLYDRTNTLIYYPGGRAAEHLGENDFAEGIKALSPWAFQHARNLKSVELPDGLMTVGWMCFSFSDKLESVTIPASVKSIDGYAFCDCENLQKVTILNPDMTFKRDDKDILNRSPKAILCGYDNSTTQAYAEKHGLKFESLGAAPGKTK